MLKSLAIFIAGLILLQSFDLELEEISKISTLVAHAQMHADEYGDSFVDFIEKHYGKLREEHRNADHNHDQLPYQKHQHKCIHYHFAFVFPEPLLLPEGRDFVSIPLNFIYKEPYTSFVASAVFQPPRNA